MSVRGQVGLRGLISRACQIAAALALVARWMVEKTGAASVSITLVAEPEREIIRFAFGSETDRPRRLLISQPVTFAESDTVTWNFEWSR